MRCRHGAYFFTKKILSSAHAVCLPLHFLALYFYKAEPNSTALLTSPSTPPSALRRTSNGSAARSRDRHVRFSADRAVYDVYHREEYDRKGDFNPEISQLEWEKEEEDEKRRMLEVRWTEFEKSLPPGQKCEERLADEARRAEQRRIELATEEAARKDRLEKMQRLQEAR